MTLTFVHDVPASRVVFGEGSIAQVPAEVERLGCTRVLLVSGGPEAQYAEQIADLLGDRVADVDRQVIVDRAFGDALRTFHTEVANGKRLHCRESRHTCTQAGDKAETSALNEVFAPGRQDKLRIGSVKTNIGHLEAAAGMSGLIKTVLSLSRDKNLQPFEFEGRRGKIAEEGLAELAQQ